MSIKSLGKIAAIAAVAGLALTACADDATNQARAQEETCGLLQSSSTKASSAMSTIRETEGPNSRASFSIESAALDLRNHSYDRSNDEPANGDTVALRNALQTHAAYFQEMSDVIAEDVAGAQNIDTAAIEVDGMNLEEATAVISAYCGQAGGF